MIEFCLYGICFLVGIIVGTKAEDASKHSEEVKY